MKKIFLLCILVFFFSSCGRGGRVLPEAEPFLYDLDFMMNALEADFALFDAAYWIRGVDIHELADNARADILATREIDEYIFGDILAYNFARLFGFAHFGILTPRNIANPNPCMIRNFGDPDELAQAAMDFGLDEHDSFMIALMFSEGINALDELPEMHEFLSELIGLELADEFVRAIMDADFYGFLHFWVDAVELAPDRTTMEIIQPGRIAYIAVLSPIHAISYYEAEIMEFFGEVEDFEHLIIDLRGNSGGFPEPFFQLLISPIISRPIVAEGFAFMRDGSQPVRRHAMISQGMSAGPVQPLAQILAENELPELNMRDMERLEYGFRIRMELRPNMRAGANYGREPAFNGKIWLLTDGQTSSAAQIASWAVKETGFATIVGDVTHGNYGGVRSFTRLPNSDIWVEFDLYYVTDSQGRPLEAGTIPHYFNRPGMDAMESVLAIIAEGAY